MGIRVGKVGVRSPVCAIIGLNDAVGAVRMRGKMAVVFG
jgi:hypothetical protein